MTKQQAHTEAAAGEEIGLQRIEETEVHPKDRQSELGRYMTLLRHYPVVRGKQDFDRLFRQYRMATGPQKRHARDLIVYGNMRLVVWVAFKFVGRGLSLSDLLQEGAIAVTRSVERFDAELGFRFSTFAVGNIRRDLQRAIEETGSLRPYRIPSYLEDRIRYVKRAFSHALRDTGRVPTNKDILDRLHGSGYKTPLTYTLGDIAECRKIILEGYTPLDGHVNREESDGATFGEVISDPERDTEVLIEARELLENHERALERIADVAGQRNRRHGEMLRMRFGIGTAEPQSLKEVGDAFDITRERVRQIQKMWVDRFGLTDQDIDDILETRDKLIRLIGELSKSGGYAGKAT